MSPSATRFGLLALALAGCERVESAAKDQLGQAASVASTEVKDLTEGASGLAQGELARLGDGAAAAIDAEITRRLEGARPGSIEARVVGQKSSAKEVIAIIRVVAAATESDTVVLPIYRPVGGDEKDIDAAIGKMPRTEVIDGVTVGFSQTKTLSTREKVDEEAYLVLWRRDDALVGFLYKKNSRIDITALIEATPRLMKLVNGAIAA